MLGNFRFCLDREGNKIIEVEASDNSHQIYHLPCYHRLQRTDHAVTTEMPKGRISNDHSALFTLLSSAI